MSREDLFSIFSSIKEESAKELRNTEDRICKLYGKSSVPISPEEYSSLYTQDRRPPRYSFLPTALVDNAKRISHDNIEAMHQFNRYMMFYYLYNFSMEDSHYHLPVSIARLYPRDISRITAQMDKLSHSHFDLSNDAFLKDMAILTHRLIPVGAEFAEPNSGIPRRTLFKGGIEQFIRGLSFVTFKCQGFYPFFALHTHDLSLEDFHPEGWIQTYRRLAELLVLNPEVKGWLSASWFLDPKLQAISPHLSYLWQIPVENGGALFFVDLDREGKSGALSKSPTRRHLFIEGRYVPAIYMRVWPRRSLIDWSARLERQGE